MENAKGAGMYPSGTWRGFWQQEGFGRQPMEEFQLTFRPGEVRGRGTDVIGPFIVHGEWVETSGAIHFVKQYVARHAVLYRGSPDGEGSILGTWEIESAVPGMRMTGPFLIQPVPRKNDDNSIQDIKPG